MTTAGKNRRSFHLRSARRSPRLLPGCAKGARRTKTGLHATVCPLRNNKSRLPRHVLPLRRSPGAYFSLYKPLFGSHLVDRYFPNDHIAYFHTFGSSRRSISIYSKSSGFPEPIIKIYYKHS